MRTQVFSRFHQTLQNLTHPGCAIRGEVYNPETAVNVFEESVRLFRTPQGSVAHGGDHVVYEHRHYVLSPHTTEQYADIFRLIPMPDQVVWKMRNIQVKDPVTGLLKDNGTSYTSNIWVRELTKGFSSDLLAFDRQVLRYVCGSTIHEGDTIDGRLVKKVYTEQGVLIAET